MNEIIVDPLYKDFKCLSFDEKILKNNLNQSILLLYENIVKFLKKDNKESNLKEDLNTYKIIETLKEKINEKIKG